MGKLPHFRVREALPTTQAEPAKQDRVGPKTRLGLYVPFGIALQSTLRTNTEGDRVTKPQGYRQSAAEAAFCLFALSLPHYQSLLIAGIGRTIIVALFAFLLMFLVVRSPEICRVVADCLIAFVSWLGPSFTQKFHAALFVSQTLPRAPIISPLFQRPPPLFS